MLDGCSGRDLMFVIRLYPSGAPLLSGFGLFYLHFPFVFYYSFKSACGGCPDRAGLGRDGVSGMAGLGKKGFLERSFFPVWVPWELL